MAGGLPAWQRREAFKYVESLPGPLLAWEYLRRNAAYRNAWQQRDSVASGNPGSDWGLLRLIDPALDARGVNPIWHPDPPTTLRLIRASGAADGLRLYDLDIDRTAVDGVRDQEGTYFTATVGGNTWQIHVADNLESQDKLAISIAADDHARQRAAAADRFLQEVHGKSVGSRKRGTVRSRSGRFHASVLQALDGAGDGASHREIAVAIHGAKFVSRRWTPDGELRASIRYFLKRGARLVDGEYRRLIYR